MCFSASASFFASGILATVGVTSIKLCKEKKQYPFASIPLIFGIQQFCEGLLWLSLTRTEYDFLHSYSASIFLIFAQVVWPFLVPLSIYLMEKDIKRKKVLAGLSWIGGILAIYLLYRLFSESFHAEIAWNHLRYKIGSKNLLAYVVSVFYMISTIVPAFVSSIKKMRVFGAFNLISFVVTVLLFDEYIISIWCFFAAILSVYVYFILKELNKRV